MLGGILGRGFGFKCKLLIKQTKARIVITTKKRNATENFLKKDIAHLLNNGLDVNAYGRAQGLVTELMLTSCYGFIEQCCDMVLNHLSVMHKQSECPDECKEAVSSLMYAAARFPKLPELQDLREAFRERYGDRFLECFVNRRFVEKTASKTCSLEKKVQLMKDITTDFSVKWDSNAFKKRMLTPPLSVLERPRHTWFSNVDDDNKIRLVSDVVSYKHRKESIWKTEEVAANNHETMNENKVVTNRMSCGRQNEPKPDMSFKGRRESFSQKHENLTALHHNLNYNALAPPYVKPSVMLPKVRSSQKPEKIESGSNCLENEGQNHLYLDDNGSRNPFPKPRRTSRRSSKSRLIHQDVEKLDTTRRRSRTRRKDEERVIDKLLIHYSNKVSAYDPENARRKINISEFVPLPVRSISLSCEQPSISDAKIVLSRAASFQPDRSVKHIHPKLPEYDDLAARFAALKVR